MRLVDLDPSWIDHGDRRGIGVRFRCMTGHCKGYLWILFANPIDGGPAYEGESFRLILDIRDQSDEQDEKYKYDRPCGKCRWQRIGEGFATMSMAPSVDAHECGHLTLTNGVFA